ncbi:aldose 1-epimerase [Aromatoleum toluclasticum]|uniref:aldose 1-epimerase n=1 Tax=Aromatoleum toluclasticum TaxID=92003 RepID=UPI00036280E1|nr:aldose 1-epimerase [Aromatoleum toluclasticum]
MDLAVAPVPSATSSAYRVRRLDFGGIPAVELRDGASGAYAVFAQRGATLLDWRVPHGGELVELTDGYRNAAELANQNGVRNGIMAPFPNRIAGASYRFDGRDLDLRPGVPAADRLSYHGFLRELELVVAHARETATGASVLFTGTIRPDAFAGYPFALKINVRVGFTARSIALTVTATNIGDRAAPYAAGWHPYFRLGDAPIEDLELEVPASYCILTDDRLLPLAGDAAYARVDDAPMPDFRRMRRIGDAVIDACYGGAGGDGDRAEHAGSGRVAAIPGSESLPAPLGGMRCASPALQDGLIRSRLRDPATGRQLTVWQRGGLVHVFTGDTLARDPRRAVAIEPVEVMTDSFNRPDCARAIRLPAGATSSFSCGAEFDASPSSQPLAAPSA